MSTTEDLRATEKKLQEILDAFKDAAAHDLNRLSTELRNVSDDYTNMVRELEF